MPENPHLERLPYAPQVLGHVEVDGPRRIIAGSMTSIRIVYTAGRFGIDDQGSVRFLFRFASDAGRPQFERANAPNYCTVHASNGALLVPEYHPRGAFRPWFKAVRINVMRGALKQGDQVTVVLGDRSAGSAGWRMSSMREPQFEIRTQVDPFGAVVYGDVSGNVVFDVTPGEPRTWKLVIPTFRRTDESFALSIRADDACGNPVTAFFGGFRLEADGPLSGLPCAIEGNGQATIRVEGLRASSAGTIRIRLRDHASTLLAESNPLVVAADAKAATWWGDFHAQSEETVGTNSARDYFEFARNLAFCDFVGHQGNDFQISTDFWQRLNDLYREYNEPHRFVTIPGYEYSPVTALGGDRNIFFFDEHRTIRRSSHALVEDTSDISNDCNHVCDLFETFNRDGENVLAFAHVGGRYADLRAGHDVGIERSVEIHSSWGTFEWLLFDAFELGHRVGVVCNSDDHKGRPGASHPGASIFGAYGGLTCLYLDDLTRASIWKCLKSRHHYGTTGDRLHLSVNAELEPGALRYEVDPLLNPQDAGTEVQLATMGDIVGVRQGRVRVAVSIEAASPIERVELRRGAETLETLRPYDATQLGRRVRVIWEGAEYRGRGRTTTWDGTLSVRDNKIESVSAINFWHLEKSIRRTQDGGLVWESVTTGNFAGAEMILAEASRGTVKFVTPHVSATVPTAEIGYEDHSFEAGGLGRRLRLFRLPDLNAAKRFKFVRDVDVRDRGDSPLYVRVTLENGHQAWSSPIYVFRR